MKYIFIGFLLVFLDFNLNINTCTIGLIPDFLGYIVLVKGLSEMNPYSPCFTRAKPFALGMAVYSGIIYLLDFFGVSYYLGYLSIPLSIAGIAVSLYLSYLIVRGIREIEAERACNLNGEQLMTTWKLLAVFQAVTYILLMIPVLAIVSILVSLVISIMFLVALNRSKNLFYAMPQESNYANTTGQGESK